MQADYLITSVNVFPVVNNDMIGLVCTYILSRKAYVIHWKYPE